MSTSKNKIASLEEIENALIELLDDGFEISGFRDGVFDPTKRNFMAFINPGYKHMLTNNKYIKARKRFSSKAIAFTLGKEITSCYLTLEESQKLYSNVFNKLKLLERRYCYNIYCIMEIRDNPQGSLYYDIILEERQS